MDRYEMASALRDYSIAKAWHAANSASGFADAAKDGEVINQLKPKVEGILESWSAGMLMAYVDACVWRCALARLEQRCLPNKLQRPPDAASFESAEQAAEVAGQLAQDLIGRVPQEALMLVDAAAWYTANTRANYKEDSHKDIVKLVRSMDALYRVKQPKWRGVNLGGWLLLERGPSIPFYEANGLDGDNGEWHATEQLRSFNALRALERHRNCHITRDTIQEIARRGFNAVRVPFGYWIISGPTNGDPYMGPDIGKLDDVVRWARESQLQVLLDLHGNPGGESQDKPCGRANLSWQFADWRREEAIEVLRFIANRYSGETHVTGIQVCNEPSRDRIEPKDLIKHYVSCIEAIRSAGMLAARVSVVCPLYFFSPQKEQFLDEWMNLCTHSKKLDGAVLDFHYYFFGDWANEDANGRVHEQARRLADELGSIPSAVVGEWSVPFNHRQGMNCRDKGELDAFLRVQQELYAKHATHGDFYWNWIDGCPGWSRQAMYFSPPT